MPAGRSWTKAPSRSAVSIAGFGNDGASGYEGCRAGRVYGTYLHGPLLPRNPWFADRLLADALAHAGGRPSSSRSRTSSSTRRTPSRPRGPVRAAADDFSRPRSLVTADPARKEEHDRKPSLPWMELRRERVASAGTRTRIAAKADPSASVPSTTRPSTSDGTDLRGRSSERHRRGHRRSAIAERGSTSARGLVVSTRVPTRSFGSRRARPQATARARGRGASRHRVRQHLRRAATAGTRGTLMTTRLAGQPGSSDGLGRPCGTQPPGHLGTRASTKLCRIRMTRTASLRSTGRSSEVGAWAAPRRRRAKLPRGRGRDATAAVRSRLADASTRKVAVMRAQGRADSRRPTATACFTQSATSACIAATTAARPGPERLTARRNAADGVRLRPGRQNLKDIQHEHVYEIPIDGRPGLRRAAEDGQATDWRDEMTKRFEEQRDELRRGQQLERAFVGGEAPRMAMPAAPAASGSSALVIIGRGREVVDVVLLLEIATSWPIRRTDRESRLTSQRVPAGCLSAPGSAALVDRLADDRSHASVAFAPRAAQPGDATRADRSAPATRRTTKRLSEGCMVAGALPRRVARESESPSSAGNDYRAQSAPR